MTFQSVPLGDLFQVASGNPAPQDPNAFSSEGVPFVRAGSLTKLLAGAAEESLERLTPEAARRHRLRLFPRDTIFFAKSGMSALKGHIYQLAAPAYAVSHLAALIPTPSIHSRYARWALQVFSPTRLVKDSAYPSIRLADIEEMKIPLPPQEQQRRIAEILDQAEALHRARLTSLAALRRLKLAVFSATFGDLSEWPARPFGDLVSDTRIGLVRGAAEFGEGMPFPYVRMDAITRAGEIDPSTIKTTEASAHEASTYSLLDGDFLFNTRNSKELVGKSAVWRGGDGFLYNNNLMRVRFKNYICSEFVHSAFSVPSVKRDLERRKTGTTSVFAVYWRDLKTLPIPVPPTDLQVAFSTAVAKIEDQRTSELRHLAHLDALFASLQHRAFRGEL